MDAMDNDARKLFLEQRSDIGQQFGRSTFRLHWEFWLQLQMMADAQALGSIGHVLTAAEASVLAEFMEQKATDDGWLILLEMWGDENGTAVDALYRFMKSGGFEVVEFTK
jgi:hypothetical protein